MIDGFKMGHFTNEQSGTGATVIVSDGGAVGGVDVRGCAPGTRETDLLKGCKAVEWVNAVCLSGGSAFGLEACDGVMQCLAEQKQGFFTGTHFVPIVCGAVIYDLDYKKFSYPSKQDGYIACKNATADELATGSVGAGTGATVGKLFGMENCCKGGVGYYEIKIGDVQVGAITVTNSFGDIIDINDNGKVVAGAKLNGEFVNTADFILKNACNNLPKGTNTTIGCVLTNAKITREQANKLAELAQNGLALSISPVHTMLDGDTMFALSSGKVDADFNVLSVAVTEVVRKSVLSAVKK